MALRALIIANGEFADPRIPQLKSPVSDAQRLQALLTRDDVGPYQTEICLDLESYALRQAVERFFSEAEFADRQLLFFSGHGFKHGTDSRLYFGTKDTRRETMRSSSLSSRFVFEEASASIAQQTIIFIDSCYSGAFVKGHTLKASDQVMARDDFEVDGAHGMAIITASSSVQTAAEIVVDHYMQSVFTRHLINGIETGAADPAHSGQITLNGLFGYVRSQMKQEAPGQEPKPHYFGLDGSVEVARSPVKPAPMVPQVGLPRRLVKKIASANFSTRRSVCGELYHHADANPEAVDLVRAELTQLTRDPHDFVKEEARHQLARLEQRFLADGPEVEPGVGANVTTGPDGGELPFTPHQPSQGSIGPEDEAAEAPEKPMGIAQPFGQSGTSSTFDDDGQPRKGEVVTDKEGPARDGFVSSFPFWSWRIAGVCLILIAVVIAVTIQESRRANSGSGSVTSATAEEAAAKAEEVTAAVAPAPPGEWLMGEWAVNPDVNRCTQYRRIVRGVIGNRLLFYSLDSGNGPTDSDDITSANATELTTSTIRYRLNADGSVSATPLTGTSPIGAVILRGWSESGCAM